MAAPLLDNLQQYAVNAEEESDLMIRYTKIYTRELVFAVDLMSFVMADNHLCFENFIYPNCLGRASPSDFDNSTKKFVQLTLAKYRLKALHMMEKHIDLEQPDYEDFKCYTNAAALQVQEVEYSEYAFLVFCVLMAQMCSIAFLHGVEKAPDFGVMLMCRTHASFVSVLPSDPWEKIKNIIRVSVELLATEEQAKQRSV